MTDKEALKLVKSALRVQLNTFKGDPRAGEIALLAVSPALENALDYILDKAPPKTMYKKLDGRYFLTPAAVNKIDPDFYLLRDLYKQLVDEAIKTQGYNATNDTRILKRITNDTLSDEPMRTDALGRYVTPKLLKNLLKIPADNRSRALNEINDFFNDNVYRLPDDYSVMYDSLGSVRRAIQQYQEEDRQKAKITAAYDAMMGDNAYLVVEPEELPEDIPLPTEKDADGRGNYIFDLINRHYMTPDKIDELAEQIARRNQAEHNKPYSYSDDVKNAIQDEWRLFESPEDQVKVGCELGHCYGDTKRYGTSHKQQYINKIRGKQSILLTKGNVTAEIAISSGKNGVIDDTQIVQIQGPNNTAVRDPEIEKSVRRIADSLVGKNVNSMAPEQVEGEVSDIICKHLIKQAPSHLVNAIHRRF